MSTFPTSFSCFSRPECGPELGPRTVLAVSCGRVTAYLISSIPGTIVPQYIHSMQKCSF